MLSNSIPDLGTRTFIESQKCVIGSKDERITESVLSEGQRRALVLTKDMLSVDLFESNYSSEANNEEGTSSVDFGKPITSDDVLDNSEGESYNKHKLYDPDRPQHPEFSERLLNFQYKTNLPLAKLQSSLLRDMGENESEKNELLEKGVLVVDPLKKLAQLG